MTANRCCLECSENQHLFSKQSKTVPSKFPPGPAPLQNGVIAPVAASELRFAQSAVHVATEVTKIAGRRLIALSGDRLCLVSAKSTLNAASNQPPLRGKCRIQVHLKCLPSRLAATSCNWSLSSEYGPTEKLQSRAGPCTFCYSREHCPAAPEQ